MKLCKLVKIKVENVRGDFFAYLQTEGHRVEITLTLCETETMKAWKTTLAQSFLEEYSRRISTDSTEDALSSVFENLGTEGSKTSSEKYIYQVNRVGSDLEFSWKKAIYGDGGDDAIVQRLGTVRLQAEDPGRAFAFMMSFGIGRIDELERDTAKANCERDRLIDERHQAVDKLDRYAKQSERTTADLYTKFAAIINEKKKKIRELVTRLDPRDRDDRPETSERTQRVDLRKPVKPTMVAGPSNARGRRRKDSSSGSDTDVERQFRKVPQKKAGAEVARDDDLVFLGSESPVIDIKPAVPRQKRRMVRPPRRGPVPTAQPIAFESPGASDGSETMALDSNELVNDL